MKFNKDWDTSSFLWSEVSIGITAAALFIGGVPPVYLITPPALFGLVRIGLVLCWIISGLASAYLLYRWFTVGQKVFGGKNSKDIAAFLIMAITGLNLGVTGLIGRNIGLSILSGRLVLFIAGVVYVVVALYLWQRWNRAGKKVF